MAIKIFKTVHTNPTIEIILNSLIGTVASAEITFLMPKQEEFKSM